MGSVWKGKPYSEYRLEFVNDGGKFSLETCLEIGAADDRMVIDKETSGDIGLNFIVKTINGSKGEYSPNFLANVPLDLRIIQDRQDFVEVILENLELYGGLNTIRDLAVAYSSATPESLSAEVQRFSTLCDLVTSLTGLDGGSKSKEVRLLKEFGDRINSDVNYTLAKEMVEFLNKTRLVPLLESAISSVNKYLSALFRYGRREADPLADGIDFRRKDLIDVLLLLKDIMPDLQSKQWTHLETSHVTQFITGLDKMCTDLGGLFPLDTDMSHRKFMAENGERIRDVFLYSYDLISQMFLSKIPNDVSLGNLADRIAFFTSWVNFYKGTEKHGHKAVRPEVLPMNERVFEMQGSVSPHIYCLLDEDRRFSVSPIDFTFSRDYPVVVLTGPNSGGKTSLGRHIILSQVIAQSGLFVLGGKLRVSTADKIYFSISKGDDPEKSDGVYKKNLERAAPAIFQSTPYSLVVLDELGTGTDPEEGVRISEAVYELLATAQVRTLHTTHIRELPKRALDGRYTGVRACGIRTNDLGASSYSPIPDSIGDSNGQRIADSAGFTSDNLQRRATFLREKYRAPRQ